MAFELIAQPVEEFEEWLEWQSQAALPPSSLAAQRGRDVFLSQACVLCHTIRGTPAAATVGPDLTHVGGRRTIAAGTLPNTRGHLSGWIADAQAAKPGARMPRLNLTVENLNLLLDYLESLK
jgi:cytochrome c oxidase subunit 2